jgi:predicted alpha/beta superfamily hydrolase
MKQFGLYFAVAVFLFLARSPARHNLVASQSTASPGSQLRLHEFTSRIFGNTRNLRVLLPPGYDEEQNSAKRYPVLYLNDGQNLFDVSTSMFNPVEWQVDETVKKLLEQNRIRPLIVVGVDNPGKRERPVEYLPYPDAYLSPPVPSPRGKEYPDFLIGEVMPFINRSYRTRTDPESTGLGGSSYGAVAALYTIISRPGVFGRALLESPSLYISDNRLLKDSANVRQWPERVYVAIGTRETGDASGDLEAVALVSRFAGILKNAGLDRKRLLVVIDEGGVHREDAWGRRLGRALEFLYGK